jgi:hypothetical protein
VSRNGYPFNAWPQLSNELAGAVRCASAVVAGQSAASSLTAGRTSTVSCSGAIGRSSTPLMLAIDGEDLRTLPLLFVELFHSDSSVISRAFSVDGQPATIAAVLPETFHPQLPTFSVIVDLDSAKPAACRMLRLDPPPQLITAMTGVRVYQAIGELKAGVTFEQARAEIDSIHAREQRDHPTPFGSTSAVVTPLQDQIVGPSRRALGILLSASLIVLLIPDERDACELLQWDRMSTRISVPKGCRTGVDAGSAGRSESGVGTCKQDVLG